ncbi:MAG: hypothetical protein L6R28_10830 [Planctomycetes bacterium]|nr:hypothetical protein [Planctomycetota bacterium]
MNAPKRSTTRRRARMLLAVGVLGALALGSGCGPKRNTSRTFFKEEETLGVTAAQRRLLFAQIVDDRFALNECAILEGKTFKYLLKVCAIFDEGKLEKKHDEKAEYERLQTHADEFRGHVVTIRNAVVIEVARVPLPEEYGLPGYEVLPAIVVNSRYELFEVRLLCKPGSKTYQRLADGIQKNNHPVVQISGFFFKQHAKRTAVKNEPPWAAPLLICPEPRFGMRTYGNVQQDMVDSKTDQYLPSETIAAPRAEERLVVELLATPKPAKDDKNSGSQAASVSADHASAARIRIDGTEGAVGDQAFLKAAVDRLIARLPEDQRDAPSGVLLRAEGAPKAPVRELLDQMEAAGLKRVYLKDENNLSLDYLQVETQR